MTTHKILYHQNSGVGVNSCAHAHLSIRGASMDAASSTDDALEKAVADMSLIDVRDLFGTSSKESEVKDWNLPLEPLYKLCMKYYKGLFSHDFFLDLKAFPNFDRS